MTFLKYIEYIYLNLFSFSLGREIIYNKFGKCVNRLEDYLMYWKAKSHNLYSLLT